MLQCRQARRQLATASCTLPRGIVRVAGSDAAKFLNGLSTATVTAAGAPSTGGDGRYAAFLSPQGRMLYEAFIYRGKQEEGEEEGDSFLIDCDGPTTEDFIMHLRQYKLRSKVAIINESHRLSLLATWQTAGGAAGAAAMIATEGERLGRRVRAAAADGRGAWSMARMIVEAQPGANLREAQGALQAYTRLRYLQGIPEGPAEVARGRAIPLEYNMDFMGAIDGAKSGCYLGQELVTRTLHRGVVRKRIVPILAASLPVLQGGPAVRIQSVDDAEGLVGVDVYVPEGRQALIGPHDASDPNGMGDASGTNYTGDKGDANGKRYAGDKGDTGGTSNPGSPRGTSGPGSKSRSEPVGKIVAFDGTAGLALVRLDQMQGGQCTLTVGARRQAGGPPTPPSVTAALPPWWPLAARERAL